MPLKNDQIPCVEIEYFLKKFHLNVTCEVAHIQRADAINQLDILSK